LKTQNFQSKALSHAMANSKQRLKASSSKPFSILSGISELLKDEFASVTLRAVAALLPKPHEDSRAEVLSKLAQIDGADFAALLKAARSIQSESRRAAVLSKLAEQIPQDFLPNIWKAAILDRTHNSARAKALSDSLLSFPLATLPYSDWQTFLHVLAHRQRSDLIQDLATLYPVILHLGGKAAMRGVVNAMREVCRQWK
jgi:hypothetical protein